MKRQTALNTAFLLTLLMFGFLLWRQGREIGILRAALAGQLPASSGGASPFARSMNAARSGGGAEQGKFSREVETPDGPPSRQEFQDLTGAVESLRTRVNAQPPRKSGSFTISGTPRPPAAVEVSRIPPKDPAAPPKGPPPSWNHAQATGAPDTAGSGDKPTAWAPRSPRSGEQWLQLAYDKSVEIGGINVMETHNPGAISRVTAILPDGSEREIWQGTSPSGEAPVETAVPVPPGISSDQIRIYVDTNRVPSWPEIDAVELVGKDGSRQWASSSKASSSYNGD